VFAVFAVACIGFLLTGFFLYWNIRKESDYWGLGREVYYSFAVGLFVTGGFILSFIVSNSFQIWQTFGFVLFLFPQAVFPVYSARKLEGKRRIRKTRQKQGQDGELVPVSSRGVTDAGTSVLNNAAVRINVRTILNEPELFHAFEKHLTSELAVETILFLKDAKDWKDNYETEPQKNVIARKLYKTYIENGSVLEINISHQMKEAIRKALETTDDIPKDTYDVAIKEITFIVQTGPLVRFSRTQAFVDLAEKLDLVAVADVA